MAGRMLLLGSWRLCGGAWSWARLVLIGGLTKKYRNSRFIFKKIRLLFSDKYRRIKLVFINFAVKISDN
jgi:hypothetical protein